MPKNLPSLKARQLIRLLESGGCEFYREGKGDHKLYVRYIFSPHYVLRIFRQFGFSDDDIETLLR